MTFGDIGDILSDSVIDFLYRVLDFVFGLFYDIFKMLYSGIRHVLSDSWFTSVGYDFFGFMFNESEKQHFSFNIVFFLVGLMLFFFILKHFIFPFMLSLVQAILDLFTPM